MSAHIRWSVGIRLDRRNKMTWLTCKVRWPLRSSERKGLRERRVVINPKWNIETDTLPSAVVVSHSLIKRKKGGLWWKWESGGDLEDWSETGLIGSLFQPPAPLLSRPANHWTSTLLSTKRSTSPWKLIHGFLFLFLFVFSHLMRITHIIFLLFLSNS